MAVHILCHGLIYFHVIVILFFSCGAAAQRGPWPPHSRGFLITQRRNTVGGTPLDE